MYSSAVCERDELPGPNFNDCHCINAWSLNVGDPNGSAPNISNRLTIECVGLIHDGFRRVERGVNSHSGTAWRIISNVSTLE